MSLLSDSRFLLDDANRQLDYIEQYHLESLHEKHISLILRLKIKHFLEDCRSSLDYAAFQIYAMFCKEKVTTNLEVHERYVSFPFSPTKQNFDKSVKQAFIDLKEEHPDIVSIFEKVQVFSGNDDMKWFYYLNDLCNKKKHRKLAHEERIQNAYIRNLEMPGIKITNATMINVGTPVVINGKPLDFKNPHPSVTNFDGVEWVNFIFTDINQSVLPTLRDIYSGTTSIIDELEKLL